MNLKQVKLFKLDDKGQKQPLLCPKCETQLEGLVMGPVLSVLLKCGGCGYEGERP